MFGKYRRDDSDEDDDNSSLEEGQTRSRHPKHRSKTSIDREIHVRDSRKSDEDRRNHNGGVHRDREHEREIRDDRYRDSSSRRYDDTYSRRRREKERERDSSDSEKDLKKVSVDRDRERERERERDVRRGKEKELEEKIIVKNSKIDDPAAVVVVERNRDSRQDNKLKADDEKDLRHRYKRDDRESGRRDGDYRRRRNRDSSESDVEDERRESKTDVVDRRDSSSRRHYDKSKSEDDVKVVKDLDVRDRRGDREIERGERDSRRRKRDSSESEEDVSKSKVDHRDSSSRRHHDKSKAEDDVVEVKDSDVRGRRDERVNERRDRDSGRRKRDSSESEEDVPKSKVDHRDRYKDNDSTSTRRPDKKVLDSDEDGEIRDGKGTESRHRRRRHDDDSESSDEDPNRSMKNKGKNQNGERMKEDGRRKESSDDEEKVKRGKRHREVESTKHRGRDEHPRDRERERKLGKKRDDYDDTPRRPRASEDEIKPRRHFLDRVTDKELKKYSSKPGNPEPGTYAALGSEGLNTDAAAIAGKTGGVYIPPFKLAQMMKGVEDKSSREYQRLTWDALRKSINGLVNKVNAANLKNIVTELFEENLIRGRGLFCRSCMKSQMASPGFTDVFSALVAVVNTKFPQIGELLLRRISLQLKRAYKRNDKHQLLASVKFIAHLVNQQVAHEIIALELLTVLLEKPSDDSVEVAVGFVTECGALLQDLSPQGLQGIFERFRGILHEGQIDKRVQFLIEGLFAIRRAKFQGHVAVRAELDLVDPEDQLTHELSLEETVDPETSLDIFQEDPDFLENEKRYEDLAKNILGDDNKDSDESSSGEEVESGEDDDDSEEENEEAMKIKDETETNLVNLRRTIYLTIMSSVDFEEAGHKLLKIKLEPGQEMELCIMLLECCSQERTYLRYYGLLGQRFCMINKIHQENFEKCFVQQYSMIHRLETNKLRNVAKFFAHLLGTDALPWHVLSYIRLTEEDTTSSSRIFIKILFQELSEHLGIRLLNERLTDPAMQDSFDSIFPKDNPKNTRFSINFFTSIGLGGITENLREYLKNMPRLIMQQQTQDDDDSNGGSSPSGSSGSDSESSEEESPRKKRKRRH